MGPCQELFRGVYSSVDVFFGIAEFLGLGRDWESGDGMREEMQAQEEEDEEEEVREEGDVESIMTTI